MSYNIKLRRKEILHITLFIGEMELVSLFAFFYLPVSLLYFRLLDCGLLKTIFPTVPDT